MTVLFVILTFGFFLTLDWFVRQRRAARQPALVLPAAESAGAASVAEPVWVAGYQMPENCHYHPGHTWARAISDDTAVVGLDDFARKLIGSSAKLDLPALGAWLRQGARSLGVGFDGRAVELVSPIEGEVVEVNPALATQPSLATDDPFGRGWLFKVRSTEMARGLANLLSGSLARRFMEDSRERLQHQLMALSGTVLADGGEPTADFARHLPDAEWRQLVREFLLT